MQKEKRGGRREKWEERIKQERERVGKEKEEKSVRFGGKEQQHFCK